MAGGGSEEGMTVVCEVLSRTLFRAVCLFRPSVLLAMTKN
jgi:hypothetical protein